MQAFSICGTIAFLSRTVHGAPKSNRLEMNLQ